MAEVQKSKAKSSKNWPVLAAAGLCIVFIVGVWVNNYRVQAQAATVAAAAAASHK
jgi:hypothetical protein